MPHRRDAVDVAVRESTRRVCVAVSRTPSLTQVQGQLRPELALIIKEAKYLDRLGFTIPETALQIALQEDKFHAYPRPVLKLSQYDSLILQNSTC